ncbi:MAG: ABC transporter substrate-binding protein [Caldicoprobacterales bacterium]|nr:substrate-binding domain-containing protein [Clostridiales bacterium]
MKKRLLVFALVISVMALAIGCQPASKDTQDDKPYIAMIALGYGHQFWQAVRQGAEEAAKDYNVRITFEGPEEETMVDKQVDMLKTALANNPAAVALAAIDVESVTGILKDAKAKGIRIVGFDSGTGEEAEAHCSTDNLQAAALAAENAARILNGKGKIGIVGHSQTVIDAVQRVDGFVEKIEKEYPDIEIVDIQYGDGDHLKSAEVTKGMLQAHPDIDLIYTSNEGACVGAYNGLKEAGKIKEVLLVGFDSSAAMKEGVRSGEIVGAITQDPVGMGYKTVEAAVKLLNGEKVDSFIDTGCYWYDASNMDEDHIKPLLYD